MVQLSCICCATSLVNTVPSLKWAYCPPSIPCHFHDLGRSESPPGQHHSYLRMTPVSRTWEHTHICSPLKKQTNKQAKQNKKTNRIFHFMSISPESILLRDLTLVDWWESLRVKLFLIHFLHFRCSLFLLFALHHTYTCPYHTSPPGHPSKSIIRLHVSRIQAPCSSHP